MLVLLEEVELLADAVIGMVALEDFLNGLDLEREYWRRVGGYPRMLWKWPLFNDAWFSCFDFEADEAGCKDLLKYWKDVIVQPRALLFGNPGRSWYGQCDFQLDLDYWNQKIIYWNPRFKRDHSLDRTLFFDPVSTPRLQ